MKVVICPVCLGNGLVPNGFYSITRKENGALHWSSTGTTPEQCKSCGGRGLIVVTELEGGENEIPI